MATSEAQKAAIRRYKKACTTTKRFTLYPADADILEFLNNLDEPFNAFMRRLIREEMKRRDL